MILQTQPRHVIFIVLLIACFPTGVCLGQAADSVRTEIAFISDTQAPMCVEKLFLKSNQNTLATELLFQDITQFKPRCLFILGDVVSKGPKEKKWTEIDRYLAAARTNGIPVYALLGNHDVMGNARKGEANFNKRFPDQVNTGFIKIVDSIAVVLLNSNFNTLSDEQQKQQQEFYTKTLATLEADPGVLCIIVTCHHPPYSNSKIVGCNETVQEQFVPLFKRAGKAKLFMTGHAHDFEYFRFYGKYFLTIGGGGGLHQPLKTGADRLPNEAGDYNPEFQYVLLKRTGTQLTITSKRLKADFSGVETGHSFTIE
ncbi:MAG: metallophosphoesterase family protein [Saprospiraceae bacterium]